MSTDSSSSSARALASRRNGARSRGPKSAAGKARVAGNALKHGLSARRLVLLEDEDAAAFAASKPRCAGSWPPPASSSSSSRSAS